MVRNGLLPQFELPSFSDVVAGDERVAAYRAVESYCRAFVVDRISRLSDWNDGGGQKGVGRVFFTAGELRGLLVDQGGFLGAIDGGIGVGGSDSVGPDGGGRALADAAGTASSADGVELGAGCGSVGGSSDGVGVDSAGVFPGVAAGGAPEVSAVSGDVSAAVSSRTEANRAKRARAKERKVRKQAVQGRGARGGVAGGVRGDVAGAVPEWRRGAGSGNAGKRGFFAESTPDMRHALRMSRGERLIAENDLKAFQARRRLELEKDKDVNALKKLNEAQLLRRTETNKVQIEKAYASLAATGNVPGVGGSVAGGGSVETVVSGSSNSYLTISPGSSVSMKEVHEMQKENLRLKKREEDFVRRERELIGKLKACGVDVPAVSNGSVKTSWTVDKYGDLLEKYRGDPAVPEGLVMDIDCRMRLDPDGKVEERVAKYYEEMSDQVSEIVMY